MSLPLVLLITLIWLSHVKDFLKNSEAIRNIFGEVELGLKGLLQAADGKPVIIVDTELGDSFSIVRSLTDSLKITVISL